MRTTVGSSRRVGVWAARNRATPTSIERRLLRTLGPGLALADAGLDRLEPVELGVLDEKRVAERGDELGAGTAGLQEAVRLVARLVDHALRFEALRRVASRLPVSRVRQACRGHVEEPVEVDAQRGVHRTRGVTRVWGCAATLGAARSRAVNEWCTVSQSPWSFCTWKRTMRNAAANARARPSLFVARASLVRGRRTRSRPPAGSSASSSHAEPADVDRRHVSRCGPASALEASAASCTRLWGWRHSENSSDRCAVRRLPHECGQHLGRGVGLPRWSSASNALFVKSMRVPAVDEHVVGRGGEHHRFSTSASRPRPPRVRFRACARRHPTNGCR